MLTSLHVLYMTLACTVNIMIYTCYTVLIRFLITYFTVLMLFGYFQGIGEAMVLKSRRKQDSESSSLFALALVVIVLSTIAATVSVNIFFFYVSTILQFIII